MDKIRKILSDNPRYNRYKKPLEAARVCDTAREYSEGRFGVVSFKDGVLCLSCGSSAQAANLQAESEVIIEAVNQKIGSKAVKRIRYKIE